MVKGILLSLSLSALFVIASASEAISRESRFAATDLAEQFYKIAHEKRESGQFKAAIQAFEQAAFFNPGLAEAKVQEEKLRKELQAQAQNAYREGLQHYQLLRFEEAKQSWQAALHAIVDEGDPLKMKVETALGYSKPIFITPSPPVGEGWGEGDIRTLLESGDQAQAMLALKETLQKSPENERAKKVYANLETSLKKEGTAGPSKEIEEKFAEAKQLLDMSQNKSTLITYHQLKKAHALFQGDDLKPPFFKQIEDGLEKSAAQLTKELEPKLARWEKECCHPEPQGGEGSRMTAVSLRHAIQNYPPNPKADALLQKVYERLDEKGRPLLMIARTKQEMEGCSVALEDFEAVKKAAVFSEVPAWGEAHKNLEACKKSVE
ncbi:MAG: hypothetical protein Q8P84_06265 [Deltaproteobacteria bacterium]|nr:hypothetical protein [Deltaproteobacteria bacterium]